MTPDLEMQLIGEVVRLLGQRALYWPRRRTLVLADPHFGKAASFRKAAIPVPGGTTADNLQRLQDALAATGAERLVCLGDLLHAQSGRVARTLDQIAAWRAEHASLSIVLVRGNHDKRAGDPPTAWNITCVDEPLVDPPFCWRHQPGRAEGSYALAGHVHPAVRLVGPGGQRETLPCFLFRKQHGVLPAFGSFTGWATVFPRLGDRVYVIAGDEVFAPQMGRDPAQNHG